MTSRPAASNQYGSAPPVQPLDNPIAFDSALLPSPAEPFSAGAAAQPQMYDPTTSDFWHGTAQDQDEPPFSEYPARLASDAAARLHEPAMSESSRAKGTAEVKSEDEEIPF